MEWSPIAKPPGSLRREPCLTDYEKVRREFSWPEATSLLEGLPGGALNIAHEAVDRHARGPSGERLAIRFLAQGAAPHGLTYRELAADSHRFANVLTTLGVQRGECVASLMGRIPAIYATVLGTLASGAVYCPLFSAFGPEPVKARLALGSARVLVTTDLLYRRKVAPIRGELSELRHVLVVRTPGAGDLPEGTQDFDALMAAAPPEFAVARTRPEDYALLHFTSGTTGRPKGVLHAHAAIVQHVATGRWVLDLQDGDVYWCTADPGWVTGISYGVIAPLACGVGMIVDREEFDAPRWYEILDTERVTVWYTAPTAIRMLMKAGLELARSRSYPALRHLVSVGEPLNPEAVVWGVEAFGLPFHDTWWQTETGAIMIANFPCMEVRPGSMGRPVPGVEAGIVRPREDGGADVVTDPDAVGELALRPGWPSMFRGYLNEEERYRKCFRDGWYLSGDLAKRDADGYYWFVGRADDVIKAAGHLISPFEVESVLMTHPAVSQAGVIGVPDPVAGSAVKAFVELKVGQSASEALRKDILAHARRLLGVAVAPREIAFADQLPRTRSGKIMRRLLRARELGLPEGDLSTLEGAA
ncbi:MAG TPA: acetate--CoA ligase [Steroidobacteraceae bacterium]|nr:acetate--CoA ligase [Steroidobacteraceae bacterium]